jgi:hypothetical protein
MMLGHGRIDTGNKVRVANVRGLFFVCAEVNDGVRLGVVASPKGRRLARLKARRDGQCDLR